MRELETRFPARYASIADEFHALRHGGFLATFMGGPNEAQPGRVIEYDAAQKFVGAWPLKPPDDGFNPHGIAIDEAHNLMVTSDFICPLLTLHVHGGDSVLLRGSIRVWDLGQRAITRTIIVGDPSRPAGTIDVQLVPNDPGHRALSTRKGTTRSTSSTWASITWRSIRASILISTATSAPAPRARTAWSRSGPAISRPPRTDA